MQALRKLTADAHDLELADVPEPQPGPGQARIAVTGAGMCGTDLHILHGDYSSRPPVTLGHEVAGRIDAVGDGVASEWIGALVATETAFSTCGTCRWCRTGKPMVCTARVSIGSGTDGGFATHVITPARLLHRLPDWLDDHAAALMEPLACVCNAVLDPNVIEPGDRVVITGAGPIGILAAQVSAACGGQVTLVGMAADADRLALATTFGVQVVRTDDDAAMERLAEEGRARRIGVAIECAGAEAAVGTLLRLLRPRGHYVGMGLISGDIRVPFGEIVLRELQVRAGFGSSPTGWMRAVELVASRKVRLEPLVTDVVPLRGWAEARARFEARAGIKTVFDPRLP